MQILHIFSCLSLTESWAVNKFCLLADASPKVPNLKTKKYSDFLIAPGEWQLLELVHEVLHVHL